MTMSSTKNEPADQKISFGVGAIGFGAATTAVVSAAPVPDSAARATASGATVVSVVSDDTSRTWTICPLDWVTIAVGISAPGLCLRKDRLCMWTQVRFKRT